MARTSTATASKVEESTPSKARSKPTITYEIVVPDLKPLGSYVFDWMLSGYSLI